MWSHWPARTRALVLAASTVAWSAGPLLSAPAAQASTANRATLLLDSQSEWVTPPSPGAPATFTLDLSARNAPAGAQVAVDLYPRLDARDHFEDVVSHGPRNTPLSEATPIALDQLSADRSTPGGADLNLQVVTTQSTGGGQRLGLACSGLTSTGTCTGVYPVTVALLDASGVGLHRFTTFLTFSSVPSASPLDFAWVLPFSSPVSVAVKATTPAPALPPLTRSQVALLTGLASAVHAAQSVPITIEASPETLSKLESRGASGRNAVAMLSQLSSNQSVDEVPAAPYVPINLAALSSAGEPTEITAQMAAGVTVLRKLRVQTGPALPWIATTSVGKGIGSGLSRVGATQVVVQDTSLAPTPTAPPNTWASAFNLTFTGSSRPVRAAETDSFLDGQFRHAGTDPALAASQVLADLAMVHFEAPYTAHVRGMVAVPPAGWAPNLVFVRTLLSGLAGNPVVRAVTLSRFFSEVATAGMRSLQANGTGSTLHRSLARSLSAARLRLTQFTHSVKGRPPVLAQLDHLLLAAESEQLVRPSAAGAVAVFERVLSHQLHRVTFATPGTFTLTARTGVIPITVVSSAKYTIVGTLTVSGAKFEFPGRADEAAHPMTLDHVTNAWRVKVTARTSGDLPLEVRFTSPSGLLIAQDKLTVRSTATSIVGILLTALALAVLLAWWARTWRVKRRGRKRPADLVEPDESVPAEVR
jgi:hypothetical protein